MKEYLYDIIKELNLMGILKKIRLEQLKLYNKLFNNDYLIKTNFKIF